MKSPTVCRRSSAVTPRRLRQIIVNLLGNAIKVHRAWRSGARRARKTARGRSHGGQGGRGYHLPFRPRRTRETGFTPAARARPGQFLAAGGFPAPASRHLARSGAEKNRFAARPVVEDGPREPVELLFSVTDTGIGIPPEAMNRLFHSFSQVDASTTRRFGGTGLGLAISWRLAELMGGTMWVQSEMGKGSTFSFTVRTEFVPSRPRPFLAGPKLHLNDRRMLIVDDNATNRRILATVVASGACCPAPPTRRPRR